VETAAETGDGGPQKQPNCCRRSVTDQAALLLTNVVVEIRAAKRTGAKSLPWVTERNWQKRNRLKSYGFEGSAAAELIFPAM